LADQLEKIRAPFVRCLVIEYVADVPAERALPVTVFALETRRVGVP